MMLGGEMILELTSIKVNGIDVRLLRPSRKKRFSTYSESLTLLGSTNQVSKVSIELVVDHKSDAYPLFRLDIFRTLNGQFWHEG